MAYISAMDIRKPVQQNKKPQPPKKTSRAAFILLLFIVLVGFFLRTYNLGNNSFLADEFLDVNSAYGYYKTGEWHAWDFNLNKPSDIDVLAIRDERAWPYKWQVAQLFRILPLTEVSARSISVAWGIATIFIIYFTAAYFTKRKFLGLIAAFLFAVNMTAITYDRKIRMYAMFYPMYLLLSLLIYQFFEADYSGKIRLVKYFYEKFRVNILYLLPLTPAFILSLSIHLLTINIVIVVLAYALIQLVSQLIIRQPVKKYLLTILFAAAGLGAFFLLAPKETINYYTGLIKLYVTNEEYFKVIVRDYINYIPAYALMFFGFIYLLWQKKFKPAVWISFSLFIPLLLAAYIWKRNLGVQYVFAFESFMIILIACGIYFWADILRKITRKIALRFANLVFFIVVFALLAYLPNYAEFFGEDNTYRRKPEATANYREGLGYIKERLRTGDVLVTRNFRNYYFSGANVPVFNFGGESGDKLTKTDIQELQNKYQRVWVVLFDNDVKYTSSDGNKYLRKTFLEIEEPPVMESTRVNLWTKE